MRSQPNSQGVIETGFKRVEDGWHKLKFLEGIDHLLNKEKEIVVNKQGDKGWKIPLVVDDEEDDSNGITLDLIVFENKKGDQLVSDLFYCTNKDKWEKLAKLFPGDDISVFDDKVMIKIKPNLQGSFMHGKTKQNPYKDKDGKEQVAVNIIGFGSISTPVEKLEADLFPDKKGGDKEKPKGKGKEKEAPVEDEDF